MSIDADFLRLGRSFVPSTNPLLPDVAVRRRHILQNFTELVSSTTEPRRIFLKPCLVTTLPSGDSYVRTPKRLKIEESGLLRSLYKDVISPSGYDYFINTVNVISTNPSTVTNPASGSNTSPGKTTKRIRSATTESNTIPPTSTRLVQEATFSETQTSYPGSIINVQWTCDGKYVIICCKKGVALGSVASMALVATVSGAFNRVACHPVLPNVFAVISNLNSVMIYEISQRPGKRGSGMPSFVIKSTAELRFSNTPLSERLLEWSDTTSLLVVGTQDNGLHLLSFANSPNVLTVNGTKKPRRVLKLISKCRLSASPTAAVFVSMSYNKRFKSEGLANVLFETERRNAHEIKENQYAQFELEKNKLTNTFLYVAQKGGLLMVFCVGQYDDTNKQHRSEKLFLGERMELETSSGYEIVSLAADPAEGRFLIVSRNDDYLYAMDTENQTTITALYRTFGPVKNMSISAGGLCLLWSSDISSSSQDAVLSQILLGAGNTPETSYKTIKPFVALSTAPNLESLWKTDFPAPIVSLKWHPHRTLFVVAYESQNFTSASTSNWSGSTSSENGPAQGVALVQFL